ncbi:hypothetical protein GCM10008106_26280 [Mongoliitalea lutea]|uniref:Uncharacterized protein n=1 Tax=Mongoliitalea lutea TaxID=849756 RepID=A0A8J3G5Y6_9BACT|nr:hypothetical protein GCM10008106_26280 [Mongoliitalea lutea]
MYQVPCTKYQVPSRESDSKYMNKKSTTNKTVESGLLTSDHYSLNTPSLTEESPTIPNPAKATKVNEVFKLESSAM